MDAIQTWLNSNLQNHINKYGYNILLKEKVNDKFINKEVKFNRNDINHILDWLKSDDSKRHRKRLFRLSVPDAYKLSIAWTEKLNKKFKKIEQQHKEQKGIESILELSDHFKVVKLNSEFAYKREGFKMNHCVGDENMGYYTNPNIEIYSLRDEKNEPHCTIEFNKEIGHINQLKGKGNNSVVKKYFKYITEFLNIFEYESINNYELINIGYEYFGNILLPPNVNEIDTNKSIELTGKIKRQVNKLITKSDFKINRCHGKEILADYIEVHGDLLIENLHSILRLANTIVIYGDLEIVGCPSMVILGKDVEVHGNIFIEDCPKFHRLPKCFGEVEIYDCPRLKK